MNYAIKQAQPSSDPNETLAIFVHPRNAPRAGYGSRMSAPNRNDSRSATLRMLRATRSIVV